MADIELRQYCTFGVISTKSAASTETETGNRVAGSFTLTATANDS